MIGNVFFYIVPYAQDFTFSFLTSGLTAREERAVLLGSFTSVSYNKTYPAFYRQKSLFLSVNTRAEETAVGPVCSGKKKACCEVQSLARKGLLLTIGIV